MDTLEELKKWAAVKEGEPCPAPDPNNWGGALRAVLHSAIVDLEAADELAAAVKEWRDFREVSEETFDSELYNKYQKSAKRLFELSKKLP